jgi:hypothetical protein
MPQLPMMLLSSSSSTIPSRPQYVPQAFDSSSILSQEPTSTSNNNNLENLPNANIDPLVNSPSTPTNSSRTAARSIRKYSTSDLQCALTALTQSKNPNFRQIARAYRIPVSTLHRIFRSLPYVPTRNQRESIGEWQFPKDSNIPSSSAPSNNGGVSDSISMDDQIRVVKHMSSTFQSTAIHASFEDEMNIIASNIQQVQNRQRSVLRRLDDSDECAIVYWVKAMTTLGYRITGRSVLEKANAILTLRNSDHQLKKGWLQGFRRRHPDVSLSDKISGKSIESDDNQLKGQMHDIQASHPDNQNS